MFLRYVFTVIKDVENFVFFAYIRWLRVFRKQEQSRAQLSAKTVGEVMLKKRRRSAKRRRYYAEQLLNVTEDQRQDYQQYGHPAVVEAIRTDDLQLFLFAEEASFGSPNSALEIDPSYDDLTVFTAACVLGAEKITQYLQKKYATEIDYSHGNNDAIFFAFAQDNQRIIEMFLFDLPEASSNVLAQTLPPLFRWFDTDTSSSDEALGSKLSQILLLFFCVDLQTVKTELQADAEKPYLLRQHLIDRCQALATDVGYQSRRQLRRLRVPRADWPKFLLSEKLRTLLESGLIRTKKELYALAETLTTQRHRIQRRLL